MKLSFDDLGIQASTRVRQWPISSWRYWELDQTLNDGAGGVDFLLGLVLIKIIK